MFGKRRQRDNKQHWAEPGAGHGQGQPQGSVGGEERSAPQSGAPSQPSPKPDASAVLNRQPAPPIRPEQMRRGAASGQRGAARASSSGSEASDSRKLTVGREIVLSGEIRACERLVVEGKVEAELGDTRVLEIASSGRFEGTAVVDVAEIAGRFDGDLTVRERLYLRSTGQVQGTVRYRGLEIESGGRIGGQLVELSEDDLKAMRESRSRDDKAEAGPKPAAPAMPNGSAADHGSAAASQDAEGSTQG